MTINAKANAYKKTRPDGKHGGYQIQLYDPTTKPATHYIGSHPNRTDAHKIVAFANRNMKNYVSNNGSIDIDVLRNRVNVFKKNLMAMRNNPQPKVAKIDDHGQLVSPYDKVVFPHVESAYKPYKLDVAELRKKYNLVSGKRIKNKKKYLIQKRKETGRCALLIWDSAKEAEYLVDKANGIHHHNNYSYVYLSTFDSYDEAEKMGKKIVKDLYGS